MGWQMAGLHPALHLTASLPLASSGETLGSEVIPKPPRGQMHLRLQIREYAAVTASTSTIMS